MTPEEYFRKWAENCRIFIDYKPIHSHEDMMQFAKDYHTEQLRLHDVVLSEERTESDCDCKKYPHVYSYDNKPCCKNCGREWVAS